MSLNVVNATKCSFIIKQKTRKKNNNVLSKVVAKQKISRFRHYNRLVGDYLSHIIGSMHFNRYI